MDKFGLVSVVYLSTLGLCTLMRMGREESLAIAAAVAWSTAAVWIVVAFARLMKGRQGGGKR